MPLILAVEPNSEQGEAVRRAVRLLISVDLVLVETREAAMAALADEVPDLILLSALLPAGDEGALAAELRARADASHVEMITIPLLDAEPSRRKESKRRGLLAAFRRSESDQVEGRINPSVFAEDIRIHLERAADIRRTFAPAEEETVAAPLPEPPVDPAPAAVPQVDFDLEAVIEPAPQPEDPGPPPEDSSTEATGLPARIAALVEYERPAIARALAVDRDTATGSLIVTWERVPGISLADALQKASERPLVADVPGVLFVMRRLLSATSALHASTGLTGIGIATERIMLTPRADLVIVPDIDAIAITADGDDCRVDIARIALIGMSMMLERRLDRDADSAAAAASLDEVTDVVAIRMGEDFATALRDWFSHAIGIGGAERFVAFSEARTAFERIRQSHCCPLRRTLKGFLNEVAPEHVADRDAAAFEDARVRSARARQIASRITVPQPTVSTEEHAAWSSPIHDVAETPIPLPESAPIEQIDHPAATPVDLWPEIFDAPLRDGLETQPGDHQPATAYPIEEFSATLEDSTTESRVENVFEPLEEPAAVSHSEEFSTQVETPASASAIEELSASIAPPVFESFTAKTDPVSKPGEPAAFAEPPNDTPQAPDEVPPPVAKRRPTSLLQAFQSFRGTRKSASEKELSPAEQLAISMPAEASPVNETLGRFHAPVDLGPEAAVVSQAVEPVTFAESTNASHQSPLNDVQPPVERKRSNSLLQAFHSFRNPQKSLSEEPVSVPEPAPEKLVYAPEPLPEERVSARQAAAQELVAAPEFVAEAPVSIPEPAAEEFFSAPEPVSEEPARTPEPPIATAPAAFAPVDEPRRRFDAAFDFAPQPYVRSEPVEPVMFSDPAEESQQQPDESSPPAPRRPPSLLQAFQSFRGTRSSRSEEPAAIVEQPVRSTPPPIAAVKAPPQRFKGPTTRRPTVAQRLRWVTRAAIAAAVVAALVVAGRAYYSRTTIPGTVMFETVPPGSEVHVDGIATGMTPLKVTLAPGRHRVELRRKSAVRQFVLDIAPGAQLSRKVDWLSKGSGTLAVKSDPSGATVLVDGKSRGSTPLALDLPAGAHTIVLESSRGTIRRTVQIKPDEQTLVDESIFSGWVAVYASFEVEIYERGRLIGTAENKIMVPAGSHELEFRNTQLGYQEKRVVEVTPGTTASVHLKSAEGIVRVNAQPGAEVWIDGQKYGETPLGDLHVAIGSREVVVRDSRFGEQRFMIDVTLAAPAEVNYPK